MDLFAHLETTPSDNYIFNTRLWLMNPSCPVQFATKKILMEMNTCLIADILLS